MVVDILLLKTSGFVLKKVGKRSITRCYFSHYQDTGNFTMRNSQKICNKGAAMLVLREEV